MMKLLAKLAVAIRKPPSPKKRQALDVIGRLRSGQDVMINGVRCGKDTVEGHIQVNLIEEFLPNGVWARTYSDGRFVVGDILHSFSTDGKLVVLIHGTEGHEFVGMINVSDGNPLKPLETTADSVVVSAEGVLSNFAFLNQVYQGRITEHVILQLFFDEIIDNLVLAEMAGRNLSSMTRDHMLVKVLVSPEPTYSMLHAMMGMEEESRPLKSRLKIPSIYDILTGSSRAEVDARRALIPEIARERVDALLAENGLASLDDLITPARIESVKVEIFGSPNPRNAG